MTNNVSRAAMSLVGVGAMTAAEGETRRKVVIRRKRECQG